MVASGMYQDGHDNQQAQGDITNTNIERLIVNISSVRNKPAKIARVIAQLAKEVSTEIPEQYSAVSFYKITDKINYNNVVYYRRIIDRYGFFGGIVESICEKLDVDKPNSKSRIFEYITYLYISEKAAICGSSSEEECLKLIQQSADSIIRNIFNILFKLVVNSKDLEGIDAEDIEISLIILITVAFINCKILEKPPEE